MNWLTHSDSNADWKIESNGLPDYDTSTDNGILAYRWEKTFIRLTMKTAGTKTMSVNGIDYVFFDANEYVLIEITDYVRSFNSGNFTFESGAFTYTLNFTAIAGERQTQNNKYRLPHEIVYNPNINLPFYIQITENITVKGIPDGSIMIPFNNLMIPFDWHLLKSSESIENTLNAATWQTEIISDNCFTDKILFEWVGRFGVLKSWWFTIDKITYLTDKELNLQTIENGFYTLKNKRTNLSVKHLKADLYTQQYLSDLVLSDEVYIYDGPTVADKLRVKIDNNSFDVSNKKRDISLSVNKFAYDTI